MKARKKIIYDKWVSHLENTKERSNYSIRRMDLLTISISGGSIYIILETLKEIKTNQFFNVDSYYYDQLIASGSFFLIAIIFNFFSQISGYSANDYEEKYVQEELCRLEKKDNYNKENQKKWDKYSGLYDGVTDVLNTLSIITMSIGLIYLINFYFNLS